MVNRMSAGTPPMLERSRSAGDEVRERERDGDDADESQ